MRVALDAPAGAALAALAAGAAQACREGLEVELVGPADAVRAELARLGAPAPAGLSVADAPGVIGPEEDPQAACREKPDSSVMRAAEAAASRRCDAFVAVAAPAAAAAAALWHLKRLRGVLKPALAVPLTFGGRTTLVLDAGSAPDCKPWHLLQFALMGSLYAKRILGVADPSVRLLAVGAGATLGGELVRETVPLLKYAGVRFDGPLESSEVARGSCDVLVADGLSGAVLVGALAGLSSVGFQMLESDLSDGVASRLARRLGAGAFSRARERSRGPAAAGAPLLGVGGAAVVCRDPSDPRAVAESLLTAKVLASSGLAGELQARLEDMKSGMEFARTIE